MLEILPWLVIGVLLIVLIVALIKSASTWNWVPIVAVLLIFATAVFAGYFASMTFKTRAAWMQKDRDNQKLLSDARSNLDETLYGPANAFEYAGDSLNGTNNSLNLLTIGAGRIWRGAQPAVGDNNQISLTFVAPEGQAAEALRSPVSQLKQDMQVFVFADRGATIDGVLVSLPVQYVGTYLVESVANDSVTIKPLFVTEFSAGEAAQPTSSWTLFETMPGDSPSVFRDDLDLAEFDISIYRSALRDKYLPAESLGLAPDSMEYESLLDEYTFDGLSMNVIQQWIDAQSDRINDRFDPDDSSKESQVRFTAKSPPLVVDGSGNPSTDGVFDGEGLANDPNLKLGRDVTIEEGEELRVPKRYFESGYPQADGNNRPPLKQDWSAESIVDFYARPLRDYPFALRELGEKAARMRESLAGMTTDIEISQAMIEDTENQIRFRGDLIVQLQSDISRRQQELAAITAHRQHLEQEIARRQQQIRTYYEQMLELYRLLREPDARQDTRTGPTPDSIVARQR